MVSYGEMPVYSGPMPTRPGEEGDEYEFIGWYPQLTAVSGPASYTARFRVVLKETVVITSLENGGTDQGIIVNYAGSVFAERYEIQVSEDGENWQTLTDEQTETSYLDESATWMGRTYYYRVRSEAQGRWSDYSEVHSLMRNPFVDVPEETEDFVHVAWAYNNGIVNGLSSDHTLFGLGGYCTRTQFCIMLWKMNHKPSTAGMSCPFTDLGGLSANNKKGIIWCYNQKIVNGTSATTFAPNGNITRAQLAIMVWKMAGQPKVTGMSCPYTDLASLSANNQKAVIWCYNNGLIDSITGTQFAPSTKGTRALLTEMLYGCEQVLHIFGNSQ